MNTNKSLDQQIARVHINRSLEKPHITSVFGTSNPPRGLSGLIRNYAYKNFSEAQLRHWLLLMLADRINVIEAFLADLIRGKIPNILREIGLRPHVASAPQLAGSHA